VIRYLLDTNIVSELVRSPGGRVASQIAEVGAEAVATSIIVACELRFGAAKKASARIAQRVEGVLTRLPVLPFEADMDRHYATVRCELERRGATIGALDMLIAAHALTLDAVLVTDNVREFERVEGLRVENWLR
jgi:tRNA(fMet)-specific endonuclease VapC